MSRSDLGDGLTDGLTDGMIIGDHFQIRRKLGGGGMGEVYLAENLNVPDKKYAIKVLRGEFSGNPRFVEMLREEAMKQAKLEHENVGGMYDFFLWSGHYCLVQNFVDGTTLEDLIVEQPRGLQLSVALSLMRGILDGLDYAHEIGILHCDVKPANVIVDHDGRPRVIDFGIARDIGPIARDSGVAGAGTAEYMSPEQVLPPYEIDHRSDVFAAGVLFFEMLCGRLPFDVQPGQAGASLPQFHQDAPDVRSLRPDVPEPVARIVATALQRDPAARFQGCADFRQAIADYVRRIERRKLLRRLVPATLIVAAAGGTGLYLWRESVKEEQERNRAEAQASVQRAAMQTATEALANGTTSLNLLCREWVDYQIKRQGVDKARDAGLADLVTKFQVKLADMQANMDRYASNYVDSLRQLQSTKAEIVETVVAKGSSSDQRQVHSIQADVAALRIGTVPSKAGLLKRCPPPIAAP